MDAIKDIREKWYLVYKHGNILDLKKYELPALTVEVNGKLEDNDRYATIKQGAVLD